MRQPKPPAPPPPAQAGDLQVKIGKDGIKVVQPGDGEAIGALQAQAQLLKTRIEKLGAEIAETKASMNAPGSAPMMQINQMRLTGLESRRIDAEEALQRVEDQLAGIGITPATVEVVGTPAPFDPLIPFDPNQDALQEKIAIIAVSAIVFIGAPIAVAISRFVWKRTTTRVVPAANPDDTKRLERVEQAVDTIAVELERMTEGQRYLTRLLAEKTGAPAAEPVPVKAAAPAERR